MALTHLIFERERFRIARMVLPATRGIFGPNSPPVQAPYPLRSVVNLRLFVDALNRTAPDIQIDNATNFVSLWKELIFTEFGKIAEILTQRRPSHSDVIVTELRAVVAEQKLQQGVCCIEQELSAEVGEWKQQVEVLEQENREISEARELRPQGQKAAGLSNDLGELIAVVGLRGG
jgi:hypothetical protein